MISPSHFARNYNSFWNALFPIADTLLRSINLNYERFTPEGKTPFTSHPSRRGLLNEVGFEIARRLTSAVGELAESELADAYSSAATAIQRLDRETNMAPLTEDEWKESIFVGRRLKLFCERWPQEDVSFSTPVRGCGFVDDGAADLLVADTVMEVKAGERNFRSVDLRQVITYAALLEARSPGVIRKICLVNPRRGVFYCADISEVCLSAGGRTAADAFAQISSFASGAFNSI